MRTPCPLCFSLKPCLYAVRKMVQYREKPGHLVPQICIWPQHMANPGHLTIVLIRTCRQTGCRTFPVSVSFFSQHVDLVLIIRAHLPLLGKPLPPLLHLLCLLNRPLCECFLRTGWWPSHLQDGLTLQIPLKTSRNQTTTKSHSSSFSASQVVRRKCRVHLH